MHLRILILLWISCSLLRAEEIVVIDSSTSPDGTLAVAVIPQKVGQPIDGTDDSVFLIDAKTRKILRKIPEVSSSGGLWGTPAENVRCLWDPSGRHLIINFRSGRMNGSSIVYEVQGSKLTPSTIPEGGTLPKGGILDVLTFNSNAGCEFRWDKDGSLVRYAWGYIPKEGHLDEDYSKYGFPDFDQVLEFVYRFDSSGSLKLVDIRTPKNEAQQSGAEAAAVPEVRTVDGVVYHILRVPAKSVRVVWKDRNGTPIRTFPDAVQSLKGEGLQVDALMNGGIFEPGGIPSGLLVQNGKVLNPVNRNKGEGNFFLQPNGIFLIGSSGAAVIRTDEYPPKNVTLQQAVQSGPLLLRQGKVHPAFNADSASRLHRNGVGVARDGKVVLAMSDFHSPKFPNLFEFAQLFRTLGCDDALFLDGDVSRMCSGEDMMKASNRFGSMIAVIRASNEE